jgi:DNA repair exonuclease SbcCD ATPase subunit
MTKRITSMRLENFLSFREATFDFSGAGFVLVEGDNGAGKSALIDGVVWCLHGTTLRGYEKDEVVNRTVGKDCMVRVTLEDGDELYTVTRARRHGKLKNSLRVTHDNFGEDMSLAGVEETQEVVDKLLGCTRKTFLSSVVFGQDRAYRFSSLTDGEQKKILDEVIGVERFAQACAAARKQVDGLQSELATKQRELEKAEAARDEAEAEAAGLQAKDVEFEAAQEAKVEAERHKLRIAKEWVKKNATVDLAALKAAAEVALKRLAVVEREEDAAGDVLRATQATAASSSKAVERALAEQRDRKQRSGSCPTCGQKIDAKNAALIDGVAQDRLGALKREMKADAKAADVAAAAHLESKRKLKEARDAMTAAQRAVNEGVGAEANVIAWRRRVADHEERIKEIGLEVNPYAELEAKARARHEKYAEEALLAGVAIVEIEAQLGRAQFWVKAFGASGLRSLLIDTSLPLLNEEAARVSRALTGGAISVEFSATSEQKSGKVVDKFEVKVDNKHGAGDYRGNSAGERAKVDLCVGLALQRLVASRSSASFNVAFFDEVFDHLDSSAHEQVVEVLSEIDKESVFVVSHDDDLKAWFPATLRVAKRGGFSTVEP